MSNLSHLFVSASEPEGRKGSKSCTIVMTNQTTQQEVKLNVDEATYLMNSWLTYVEDTVDAVKYDASRFSDNVAQVFEGLVKNIEADTVTPEYKGRQSDEFGKAFQALQK